MKKQQRRKTRSDKFPLTLHPTGQYCKKINGKIHYFGTNKKQALKRYLDQATYLHGCPCSTAKGSDGSMPLKELCDLYLGYQHARVLARRDYRQTLHGSTQKSKQVDVVPWQRTEDQEHLNLGSTELQEETPECLQYGASTEFS